ncbi:MULTISPECIES: serine aminopeptidase domain-containing protein [Auritidibacter]|uniref:alpha/beta hydrolase family protein n=1 Tax=Auritidibacter TaxID=1160973 RepID=UPI000D72CB16|nr:MULTISPECIES: alpha/beta hydrolase [Auritidibacter]PXA80023.1 hydrolase [Auritidibacter sp. NML120779]AXR73754.1 hydrolase [Auritidibacter sp. NML130574]NIH72351.1 putative alpha/beta hydrolase [Auritidibacter ignavus]PXA78815.1 hydrolase [Auritidibacter sp. NML120636]RMX21934.1 hydrolase [Auritidibacter ignavus]
MTNVIPEHAIEEEVTITKDNGEPLVVTRFSNPDGSQPRAAVIISPAIAVQARFYRRFAGWLTTHGLVAYLYDHQGYGGSSRGPLKDVTADFLTWAQDPGAVVDYVAEHETVPVRWLGHSLGGQMLAFARHEHLEAATIVSAGTGYWKYWQHYGAGVLLPPVMWYLLAPVAVRTVGYFPGKKLGILGDIPPQVMRQWGRWCTMPRYMLTEYPELAKKFAGYTGPLTFITFADDRTMPLPASLSLMSWYSRADLEHHHYHPQDLGQERIDHMGIFKTHNAPLWQQIFADIIS